MSLKYGFNMTESDMKNVLAQNEKQQSGVRTWRQLFGNAALGYNAQSSTLKNNYADAISQAYMSNYTQQNALVGAGLSAGSTNALLAQSKNDLHTAYEQYVRNYASDAANLASAYGEEMGKIESDLTTRAKNFANLYNSAYKYLSEELYGSSYTNDEGVYDYLKDHGLDWAYRTDADGNMTDELMSWEEMAPRLFDENSNLTVEGQEFFDQMFNQADEHKYKRLDKDKDDEVYTRNFRQWLSDTDNDLYTWLIGQDDYNYNNAGTNFGTAKALLGMESTDDEYHTSEYLNEKKSNAVNSKYNDTSGIATTIRDSEPYKRYQKAMATIEQIENDESQSWRDVSAYWTERDMAKSDIYKNLWTESQNLLKSMEEPMKAYDEELKTLLGNRYSEFVNSDEYKQANEVLRSATEQLRTHISDVPNVTLAERDDAKVQQYQSDYDKAVADLKTVETKMKNYAGSMGGNITQFQSTEYRNLTAAYTTAKEEYDALQRELTWAKTHGAKGSRSKDAILGDIKVAKDKLTEAEKVLRDYQSTSNSSQKFIQDEYNAAKQRVADAKNKLDNYTKNTISSAPSNFKVRNIDENFIDKYESYVAEYKKAYDEYFATLNNYVKKSGVKKSSGF